MSKQNRRILDLAQVKELISQGLTTREIRVKLACRYVILIDFMRVHQIRAVIDVEAAAKRAAAAKTEIIEFRTGGDERFAALMRGRQFDQRRIKPIIFEPIGRPVGGRWI